MKKIILSIITIAHIYGANAHMLGDMMPKKNKSESTVENSGNNAGSVNIASDANQFDMFDAFWNAGTKVFLTETSAQLDKFSKPQNVDKNQIFTEILKNESSKIKSFKLGNFGTFKIVGENVYPLYFQGEGSKTLYFIGDYAIYIERLQSTSNEPNNNQISSQSGNVFVFSFNKDLLNGLKLEKVQKMITDYLTAVQPRLTEARKKYKEEQKAILAKSPPVFECKGIKMEIVGTKICEYTASNDGLKREVFVSIIDTAIVYQLARSKNGQMEMLKRWDVPINIINASDRYFMTHFFMNDGEKIYKAMFPIISGFEYIYWQMLCDGNQYGKFEPELVRSKQMLEVTFNDEADAKEFFEEVKKIRAVVKTPELTTPSGYARVRFYNDTQGKLSFIGDNAQVNKSLLSNQTSQSYLLKVGSKIYMQDSNLKKTAKVLVTISADMDNKIVYLTSGAMK